MAKKRSTLKPRRSSVRRETVEAYALGSVGAAICAWEQFIKPFATESRPSTRAMLAAGGFVLAYDLMCPEGETISEGIDRLMERSKRDKVITRAAAGVLVAHTVNLIPDRFDPIHQLFLTAKRRV